MYLVERALALRYLDIHLRSPRPRDTGCRNKQDGPDLGRVS